MRTLLRCCLAILLVAAGCAAKVPPAPVTGGSPRLVVVLIVDGLPERQVVDYRDQLSPDGLERFFTRGAWFTNAFYGYSYTVTGPAHATILTGAYPHRTGIISNEWIDPVTGEATYCAGDPGATYIGRKSSRMEGTSPKNLRVESLGDVLKARDPRSRVIGISAKDRGAILPAGRSGTAYMYQARTGEMVSTTYYMREHPRWVDEFNASKPADRYFGVEWKPMLDDSAYGKSLPDERKWYARGGKLPKKMGEGQEKPGPAFYAEILATPFSDDLLFAFARAAIAGEKLGHGASPDILAISLSAHDYINHAWGAESRLSQDHVLQLDRMIADFFNDLDQEVGRENYVAVLTADHGFMPAPEFSQSLGRDAGRVNAAQVSARVNAALAKSFGEGAWLGPWSAHGVILNHALIQAKGVDGAALANEARKLIAAEPGIAVAYTRAELESGSAKGKPLFDAMEKSFDRERSADIVVCLKPYWMFGPPPGTTHGSPYDYDTNVPLLFYGPPWILPGRIDTRVEVVDIAPTLARLLRIAAPAASEGKVLPLDLTGR
ncbi:MAG TPA: alkaline phosphatase family protein [Usitatibacter sp.]|nr:alkaline phosphatase family protein [Usitatibacter sp.]